MLYHAHHSRHTEDLPFWLELAAHQGDPILELGCGTGRVLLPLARAGHRVLGLDQDASMLAYLRGSLTQETRLRVALLQADMAHYRLAERFGLVIIACNTFSTLSTNQRHQTLECACQHLQAGGWLAISLPNPDYVLSLPRRSQAQLEEYFPHPLDGEPVQVSSAWERRAGRFTIFWHYDHLLPDGRVERLSAQARHELVSLQTYQAEILRAGLKFLAAYGDFDQSSLTPASPVLILLAERLSQAL